MSDAGAEAAPVLLAVVGASGGLGASALAAAVAVRAGRAGVSVVLVDGCPGGGGLDITLGVEHEEGVRWGDLARLTGPADGAALVRRLPGGEVPVLSFGPESAPPDHERVGSVVTALRSVSRLVVVDLPAQGGLTEVVGTAGARVLVIAGTSVRQLAALAAVAPGLRDAAGSDPVVCLRDGSGPRPEGSRATSRLVRDEIGLEVLCSLSDDRGVATDLVRGVAPGSRGRGALVRAADTVLGWALLGRREAT